jgi:ELWxxDGT repeat protein
MWLTTATGDTTGTTTLLRGVPANWPSDAIGFGDDALVFTFGYDVGGQLWRTDGTANGTRLVDRVRWGGMDATLAGDRVFFTNSQNPMSITDGTAAGTYWIRAWRDGPHGFSAVRELTGAADGRAFFTIDSQYRIGSEIWVSNGTLRTTRMVKDIRPGQASSRPRRLTPFGEWMYFLATADRRDPDIWRTDGTRPGTVRVTDMAARRVASLTACDDRLYFTTVRPKRATLWTTDGLAGGERRITRLPGRAGAPPMKLTCIPGGLAFSADDGQHGRELWTLDIGSRTPVLHDLAPTGSSRPSAFTVSDDIVFFTANDGQHGRELWALPPP